MPRNSLLDKVRMFLAIIVASGHIIHANITNRGLFVGTRVEDIISTGNFAVYCFFGLSGLALGSQIKKYKIGARWLFARYLRLYPLYALSFALPLIAFIEVGNANPYSPPGFWLYFLGIQAVLWNPLLVPQNSPLWTLSVEILLSFSLLIITKFSKISKYWFLCLFLVFGLVLKNILYQSLFIFYLGFFLSQSNYRTKRPRFMSNSLLVFLALTLIFFPASLSSSLNIWYNYLYLSILASTLIFAVNASQFQIRDNIFSRISLRSYSLYAVHFPVIHVVNRIYFHNSSLSISDWFLLIAAIGIVTELAYKLVEVPSIKMARKILIAHS